MGRRDGVRRWRVTGIHRVFGVKPGDEFERFIPRGQAEALIGGGAIAPVAPKRVEPKADGGGVVPVRARPVDEE